MALARRSSRVAESYIWPGFVDALATLLIVIIFVLMVFFLIQVSLAQRVSGQNDALERLRGDLGALTELLNIERDENASLRLSNQELSTALETSDQKVASLAGQISGLEDSLTALGDEKASLEERLEELSLRNRENLATLDASAQEVLELTAAINVVNDKLGRLQALLDEKEEEARLAKETTANLTKQLNDALAGKVLELQRFKSEFFGRVREALEDRSDVTIVGDRFVFQSEVLFDAGSADLGLDGEGQLRNLSIALLEIANTIPSEIDWVLQVSGHTDDIPINTDRFRDNWDLSTERALSVVRYFVLSGIEQKRLSAAGFGEFYPIDAANTPQARARNRRIEIKLTER
jgi:chemotaxis protein MotB